MKRIWAHKAGSFRSAGQFDERYYQALSPNERVETVDRLRDSAWKIGKVRNGRKRLRRIIRIIQ